MSEYMHISGSTVDGREQQAAVTVSYVVYHFSTSSIAVAMATGFTHPLGFSFFLYVSFIFVLSYFDASVEHGWSQHTFAMTYF